MTLTWYGGRTAPVALATGTAVWYHGGLPPVGMRWVRIRDPQGALETHALLATDPTATALDIVQWFVLRWQVEVPCHEVRAHLGGETPRQWSDRAIVRTTPALLGRFSVVTLCLPALLAGQALPVLPVRRAAW